MITRDFGADWKAGCAGAPPPLHVVDDNPQANHFPAPRPVTFVTPPGPVQIMIPVVAPFGDDPTDPLAQTEPRAGSWGMIGRAEVHSGTLAETKTRPKGVRT